MASIPRKRKTSEYDVFLSFRGVDTGKGFISQLHHRLEERAITTFMHKPDLQVENDNSGALLKAIEESRFAIVVLSQNYAHSICCLEELMKICECMKGQNRILPVFYDVLPVDLRYQMRSFEDKCSGRYGAEKVQQWRDALRRVSSLSGWLAQDYKTDSQLVEAIVECVLQSVEKIEKVQPKEINTGGFEVLEETREAMDELITDDDEVSAVGVYRMGGVGKTTIIEPLGPSSSSAVKWKYDVYLSFRGIDTRRGFTSHLYDSLKKSRINAFMDKPNLQVGDDISGTLLKAIEESRFAIIVLSQNYAQSTWCLEELINICKCMEEQNRILPVFYDVLPVDVRYQKRSFEEAFIMHEGSRRYGAETVQHWRDALRSVSSVSGWLAQDYKTEIQLTKAIVEYVCNKVQPVVVSQSTDLTKLQGTFAGPSGCSTGKPKLTVTSWKKGKLLGKGGFGSVYEGITDEGYFIAVKEVSLLDQDTQGRQKVSQLEQEIALLSQFEHENIVQYYGTQKDESNLYIFLELVAKGTLQNLYQTYPLTDRRVSVYTRQILQGLKYLHDRKVIHRDIKCGNILLHYNQSVKLADFGLAKIIEMNDIKSRQGTSRWMAPEVVNPNHESQGYGLPADIWSLGCTVLEMLTRMLPYPNLEWAAAVYRIGTGKPPLVPDSLSLEAQNFIHLCLKVKPGDRPTAAQLLEHPFVNKPQL